MQWARKQTVFIHRSMKEFYLRENQLNRIWPEPGTIVPYLCFTFSKSRRNFKTHNVVRDFDYLSSFISVRDQEMSEDWEAPWVANVQHGTQQATDLAREDIWTEIDDIIPFCDDEKVQQILSYQSEIHEPEETSDDQVKYYYDHMATFYKI